LVASGETFRTKNLIAATGSFKRPYFPIIKGSEDYLGEILHSAAYKNQKPFLNQNVIVVGRGNSAVQIGVELSQLTNTTLAVLNPVKFVPQTFLGKDLHFWLTITGLDRFPFWRFRIKAGSSTSVIDSNDFKSKLQKGLPKQRSMFTSFSSTGVVWADGKSEDIDAVIFATGYRDHVSYLQNLGALNSNGSPIQKAGVSSVVPGLYYLGLTGQRSFASATIRGTGGDAKIITKKIIRQTRN
ncbi:MAG: NAD(P)-binding domain-containing protein, partial [Candidatus Pristimantibacillus sp.]